LIIGLRTKNAKAFIERQITHLQQGGCAVLFRKIKRAWQILLKLSLRILSVPFAAPFVLVLRMIRPFVLVRWGGLESSRIGHFAANTEMYLCERNAGINVPKQRHVDLFYMAYKPICNQQLGIMWERVLHIWPSWIISPISLVNRLIPMGAIHEIGNNTQHDRDVHNLRDQYPPYLEFTPEEETRGESCLRAMGIPAKTPFVCLNMRDSDYLAEHFHGGDFSYHNYRDSNIQNYVLAAEEVAKSGYFVIRMGKKVREAMETIHPRVIDYATNGMRSDFMDIYLSAKCEFFISTGEGLICVPMLFRRPIVVINMVPIGYYFTYYSNLIGITKHYYSTVEIRKLNLKEIFNRGVGFSLYTSDYTSKSIELIENKPEEIRDVVIEMVKRLNGTWQPHMDDEDMQHLFWDIFPTDALEATNKHPLHGEIHARIGAHFLRDNRDWLH